MTKIEKLIIAVFSLALSILLISNIVSAITISLVETPTLAPGKESKIRIEIENNLNDKAKDVTFSLHLAGSPFIPIGNSEFFIGELDEGKDEDFTFRLKASDNIKPGDYQIPYTITYSINRGSVNSEQVKSERGGSIGLTVAADPELAYSVSTKMPVQGKQGQITLKIINKGLAEAKFASVKVLPQGFTLLSEKEVYIGAIDSDDFETATFDVIFDNTTPNLIAIVEYRNFNNEKITKNVNLPFDVYTEEVAIKAGIIQPNYTPYYITIIVAITIIIIIWRSIRKRRRMKRSMQNSSRR